MLASVVRLMNVGLRLATLAIRFMFIFFLAKYLDPASLGHYGLFTAAVGYFLYLVGFDFYVYVTREIINAPANRRGRLLKGQAALSGILYLAVLPVAILLLSLFDWPGKLLWWFAPILLLEHFNQEVSRLLISLSDQISASLIMFVRQGSWAIVMVALMIWDSDSRSLDTVMSLWLCASIVSATLGIMKLRQLDMGGWKSSIDWTWVRKGITIGATFLIATLAFRGVQTLDRYWLEALGGTETVGAYVLFLGVAGSLMVFLDASVFSYKYPELIRLHNEKEERSADQVVKRMLLQTLLCVFIFCVATCLFLPILLNWIGNPVYNKYAELYPYILTSTSLNAIGMVPHYALYARGVDKPIIYSHIAALPVFILSTWAISKLTPVTAVPIGVILSFAFILAWKAVSYWRLERKYGEMNRMIKSTNGGIT